MRLVTVQMKSKWTEVEGRRQRPIRFRFEAKDEADQDEDDGDARWARRRRCCWEAAVQDSVRAHSGRSLLLLHSTLLPPPPPPPCPRPPPHSPPPLPLILLLLFLGPELGPKHARTAAYLRSLGDERSWWWRREGRCGERAIATIATPPSSTTPNDLAGATTSFLPALPWLP